ncbi:hypothetical protein ACQKQC_06005 [Vibrio fortis]|uniref:hypothetical protein n=1 Tax=Vibrio fortis TaxID=212667 RepID=UPI0040688169
MFYKKMPTITLHEAHTRGLEPSKYESLPKEGTRAVTLDFTTPGRGNWIDCYFTCASTGSKFKVPAFKQPNGNYGPPQSTVNFENDKLYGKHFMLVLKSNTGVVKWERALKVR